MVTVMQASSFRQAQHLVADDRPARVAGAEEAHHVEDRDAAILRAMVPEPLHLPARLYRVIPVVLALGRALRLERREPGVESLATLALEGGERQRPRVFVCRRANSTA